MSDKNKNTYQELLRYAGYLIFSLSFGIMCTLLVSNIDDMIQEKRIKDSVKSEIEDVAKSYMYFEKEATPEMTAGFVRDYVASTMKDKLLALDPQNRKKAGHNKYLFTASYGPNKIDIYIKKSYLEKMAGYGIEFPDIMAGAIVTIVVFVSLIFYSEKKRQTIAIRKRYEAQAEELTKALQKHEALALLGRMTATLAHEFKTPIATISNLIQVLPSRINDRRFTERFIAITKEELLRTQQLIDNLLVYGKEIPDANSEWIPLGPFIKELARNISIRVSSSPEIEIYGDRFYLRLLFENIIRNSFQAGADEVNIRADIPKQDSDPVAALLFEDNGAGFPGDTELTELINPFVTSRSTGAGLGLFLAQKIALAHDGVITLYRPEKGAGVKITLPADRIRQHG